MVPTIRRFTFGGLVYSLLHPYAFAGLVCLISMRTSSAQNELDNVALQIARLTSTDPEMREYAADALAKFQDRRALEPLIAALRDPDPKVRRNAAFGLGGLKDSLAVEPLIALLNDPDQSVCTSVATALESIHDPRAIAPLVSAMANFAFASFELGEFGTAAVDPLISALHDKDPGVRRGAADALSRLPDPRVFQALYAALQDPDLEVRESALLSLSVRANPHREEPVLAAFKDPNPATRRAATQTASDVKTAPIADALIAALSDPDRSVRLAAAVALGQGKFDDPRAVRPLIAVLSEPGSDLHFSALQTLASIHDARVTDELLALARGAPSDQRQQVGATDQESAMQQLGKLHDPRVVDFLIEALQSDDSGVRITAADQLGKLRDPRAVSALLAALKKEPWNSAAATALGRIGAPAVDALIALLQDPATMDAAIEALSQAKDPKAVPPLVALLRTTYRGTPQPYGVIIEARTDPGPVRPLTYTSLMSALGRIGDSRAIPPLIDYLKNGPIARGEAAQALAEIGPASIEPLTPLLHDPNEMTRRFAAEALSDLALKRDEDSRPHDALVAALAAHDAAIMAGAYQFYVGLGAPGTEEALAAALDHFGDQQMAEYFLNCGNVSLEDAAIAWGQKQHFHITQEVYGVVWGKMPSPEKTNPSL